MTQIINRSLIFLVAVGSVLLASCQQRTDGMSSGTSGTDTTQSGGERIATSDTVITAKVKSALLAESKVKSTDIHVDTDKGEVVLSGIVDSDAQISQAIQVASNVNGVKKVTNKMKARK
jgi:hyperosmotically inducible protein